MTTAYAIGFVEEVNSHLDAQAVLERIAFHADKLQQSGDTIKAFCPVHKDSRFRSVLVDAERHAFRCTVKTCPGYTGGSLVDLYAHSKNLPVLQAACELAEGMQLPLEAGWLDGLVSSYLDEANAARERGDFTEAETLLRELSVVAPGLVQPRMMLAVLHDELGNSQEAAEEFVRLIDDRLASERNEDAVDLISDALTRFPQNEDVRFASIRVAEAIGNNELAIARMQEILSMREAENRPMDNIGLLEQLVSKAPHRPEFSIKLGALYEQQHNVRGESRQYEAAASYYVGVNETAQAVQWLEKVVQFNAENNRARMQLTNLLLELGELDKARDHTFRIINQHIDQQEFGPAVSVVNIWLEQEPDSVAARELLARIFLEQERAPEAAAYLVEGAKISAAAGDHTTASDLLLRAKYLTPDAVELRRELIAEFTALAEHQRAAFESIDLAEILFTSGEKEASAALLLDGIQSDISIALKVQMLTSLVNHGELQAAQDHMGVLKQDLNAAPADARAEYYELRTRLEPGQADHYIALIDSLWGHTPARAVDVAADATAKLLEREQPEDAVVVLETISSRLDQFISEATQLLPLAAKAGRPDLAGAIYQSLIEGLAEEDPQRALNAARWMWDTDPQHPSAASDIAYLLAALGNTAEAAAQYATVANLLLQAGDYEVGLQYAGEAVALSPDSLPALAAQALLARQISPDEEARAAAQSLVAALPNAQDGPSAAAGYLAAAELFPEDEDLLERASAALHAYNLPEAAAEITARQAALISGRGDWQAAADKLASAVASAPENA
jgi:tetratricopeptide (TPR) repeat protein